VLPLPKVAPLLFYLPFMRERALTIMMKAVIMPNMNEMMMMVAMAVIEINIVNLLQIERLEIKGISNPQSLISSLY
jgi:hypothetical protein